jgi:hypothetical protein
MSTRRPASSTAIASRAALTFIRRILELHAHFLDALGREDRHHRRAGSFVELDVDLAIVEGSLSQHPPQLLAGLRARRLAGVGGRRAERARLSGLRAGVEARRRGRKGRQQGVQQPLLRHLLGLGADGPLLLLEHERDPQLGEIANDRLDIASHVAHLGELRRLHLDERGLGELREAPRHLGLPHAGGADHDDVLGRDLVAKLLGNLLAPPAISQSDGHGALRLGLSDDVAIELGDDLAGSEVLKDAHGRVTTVMLSLV